MNALDKHVGGDQDLTRHSDHSGVISRTDHNGVRQAVLIDDSLNEPKLS
jgi:hypothetical protein